ncbi:aminopeptidase P family protein [Fodinicurvata sediminis]|uniref:aminopeptidase P family protein n=1 Tax=Fodinicurvata sediminis TaxID=1121832 RepID=UPI0003B44AC8|nr:aminopeptidase P family protein [Fodinicurvata sediminis]
MTDHSKQKSRLAALRAELRLRGLDGFVVPRSDEFQGEYVPASAERLAWLTGFTGSAGFAIVLSETAAVFVDGRYTLQVRNECDPDIWSYRHVIESPRQAWLVEHLPEGGQLGYDPFLHSQREVEALKSECERLGAYAVACPDNPLDSIWEDRPEPPSGQVESHPLRFAGESVESKRQAMADELSANQEDAVVLTRSDSIAWLLNIRGSDVPHCPLALSFAILNADGTVDWFIEPRRVPDAVAESLGPAVRLHPANEFAGALGALGGKTVRLEPESAVAWIFDRLRGAEAEIRTGQDPCQLPKAAKNETEVAGTRAAHLRDGAALCRFLAWLDEAAAEGDVSEMEASRRLLELRRSGEHFRDTSFETISGSGPNGAIVHYRVTEDSDRHLQQGELYLVDSGGQYMDGTTDVTRTVAIGTPTAEMIHNYTRVLKGHIALATARFPVGTAGGQLDVLARRPLWEAGLDYDHGTGHGVGSYLNVHEGPQRIAKRPDSVALQPGMILSNEPGYYKTGAYGIRIENLVVVRPVTQEGERPMLEFETLTLAPLDRRLIETGLLTREERDWVDDYHARVLQEIAPQVDAATRSWLEAATQPLG